MNHTVLGLMLMFSFGAATLMLLRFVKAGKTDS
jgi:hypothetical protein